MPKTMHAIRVGLLFIAACLIVQRSAFATFFYIPSLTEEVGWSVDVVFAKCVERRMESGLVHAKFRVMHVHKGAARNGYEWVTTQEQDAEAGRTYMVSNRSRSKPSAFVKKMPRDVYDYAIGAPTNKQARDNIAYYCQALESETGMILRDALRNLDEFEPHFRKHRELMDRDVIRRRFDDGAKGGSDYGYNFDILASLLGVCGNAHDHRRLRAYLDRKNSESGAELIAVIAAYLNLFGENALRHIERTKLSRDTPEWEAYYALLAVENVYHDGRIPRARLKQTVRKMLGHPHQCGVAINVLAGWKDWSVHQRLLKAYGTKGFDRPRVREQIVGYMFEMQDDKTQRNADGNNPADQNLAELRRRDPRTVKRVEQEWGR